MPLLFGSFAAAASSCSRTGGWDQGADLAVRPRRRRGLRGDRAADPDPAHGKLDILRQPISQRILRHASLDDDIAIWGVLALILMDWERIGQNAFLRRLRCAATAVPA